MGIFEEADRIYSEVCIISTKVCQTGSVCLDCQGLSVWLLFYVSSRAFKITKMQDYFTMLTW